MIAAAAIGIILLAGLSLYLGWLRHDPEATEALSPPPEPPIPWGEIELIERHARAMARVTFRQPGVKLTNPFERDARRSMLWHLALEYELFMLEKACYSDAMVHARASGAETQA